MRGVTRVVLPMCLMTALLAGCSQGTTPEGSAGSAAQGSAAAEAVQEAPQPEMSNWQDKAFYDGRFPISQTTCCYWDLRSMRTIASWIRATATRTCNGVLRHARG